MARFVWEETMDERGGGHKHAMQSLCRGIRNHAAFLAALRTGKLDDLLNHGH